jgi:hypothetical protein
MFGIRIQSGQSLRPPQKKIRKFHVEEYERPLYGFDQKISSYKFITNFVIINLGLHWIRIQQQTEGSGFSRTPGSGSGFSGYRSETLLLRLFQLGQQGSMQRIRNVPSYQYCGSGTVCFWASWIRIRIHYSRYGAGSF